MTEEKVARRVMMRTFELHSSFESRRLKALPSSPALPGIAHGRQAFAKIRLLAFRFPLLVSIACLLLGAGARTSTA